MRRQEDKMEPNSVIQITGVTCRPDQEEKLNKWMNERHMPDLMKCKKVKRITRCKLITPGKSSPSPPEEHYPPYIAIYEFENWQDFEEYNVSSELAEAIKERDRTWGDDRYKRVWRVQYEVSKTFEQ